MAQNSERKQFHLMHPLYDAIAESDLTAPQAHLLLVLYKFADGNGVCWPSYNKLLKYSKMSRNTLAKHIKSLVDSGWIEYDKGDNITNKANTYRINLDKLGFETLPYHGELAGIALTHARSRTETHTYHKFNSWWVSEEAANYCKAYNIRELYDPRTKLKATA